MKKTLKKWLYGCFILLGSIITETSNAQTYCSGSSCEMVCNGGFETTSGTPIAYGQLSLATGWSVYTKYK